MIQSQSHCFRGIITIYFFFCLLSLPNTYASTRRFLCRDDQRDALLKLKEEFPSFETWNRSIDCCSWDDVTCDAVSGEVISLDLSGNLSTILKPNSGLFELQHLTDLDLSDCYLQGEISSSIGNLSRLTSLDLSYNQLVGEVPISIGNLTQLRYMDLSNNELKGNIPISFANLKKLSMLSLRTNQFTGGVHVLPNLTSLSHLDLSSNHFKSSITADLSGLHNLKRFLLYSNSFFGPFPSTLFMIPSLTYIGLDKNQFDGPIDFENTSSSSQLAVFEIGSNNFDGLIPKSISKLLSLHRVDLSHNNFRGPIPTSIANLVNLSSLDLSYNNFEGQIPQSLWRSSKLYNVQLSHNSFTTFGNSVEVIDSASIRELDLRSNSLQGPFPQWICKLRDLWALDVSNNHLTGSVPQCFTYIQELNMRNNSLSGSLPDSFINGSDLRSLDVSHNNFVGKLPRSLINCKNMQFLNVKGNKIKDTFPFWLGSLQSLKVLVLRSNAFYGPVYNSSTYSGFQGMRIIDISDNNFVGSLPQDYFTSWSQMSIVWSNEDVPESMYIGDESHSYEDSIDLVYKGVDRDILRIFKGFTAVDFSGNRLYGHIPGSIGMLRELRLLNLSGNAFTGDIPPSLANITNLETLDLSRNILSGEIPQGLGTLTFLSTINFSHNHLQGFLPRSTQFERQNCSSFAGNPGLHGLEKICEETHVLVPTSQQPEESLSEPEESVVNWIAAAIACGPGVFCGLVIGHIFTSYKHEWFTAH